MQEASGKRRKEPRADDFSFPEYRAPEMSAERYRACHNAATAFAKRHASDPFAYGRIMLYMKRGIFTPDEVRSDSRVASTE